MKSKYEKKAFKVNGFVMLILNIAILGGGLWLLIPKTSILFGIICLVLFVLIAPGYFAVQPNESRVLIFFGSYTGMVSTTGFWWANPFAQKVKVSLRVHNFESSKMKVNDKTGNPIEIAAVVSWKVVDPGKATFDVEQYMSYISTQSETAIRTIATNYPYDTFNEELPGSLKVASDEDQISLRENSEKISEEMKKELGDRLDIAGVEVLEARITHLAYAPEIAQAMLRRQQAEAIIMARKKIVDGAVGMVEMALKHLDEGNIVDLDDEKKASMINNLLVTLTSDRETQPVVNTGTLYT